VSYRDNDRDHSDWLGGPYTKPNAKCGLCGREFWMNHEEDTGDLCDSCVRSRDRRIERAARALQRVREQKP